LADDELSIFCPSPRISSYLSGQHGPVSTRRTPSVDVGAQLRPFMQAITSLAISNGR